MRGKLIIKVTATLTAVMLMMGCTTDGNGHDSDSALAPEQETYRDQLTDEEMGTDYIELQLAETVKLKGTIMPQNKYEEGVNVYYAQYMEALTIDLSNEEWDSLIMDKTQEILGIIENESLGKFNMDELEIYTEYNKDYPVTNISVPYTDVDVVSKLLWMELIIDNDKNVKLQSLDFNNYDSDFGEATSRQNSIAYDIRNCTPDYSDDMLGFGSETTGDIFYRTFIEEFTGEKLAEKNVCVPVTRENFEEMKVHHLGEYSTPAPEEDYYQYFYYWQIDGYTVKRLFWGVNPDELGDVDISLVEDDGGGQISLEGTSPSIVSYDADGIRSIGIRSRWEVGEVYKEKQSVVDINVILKKATKYFEDYFSSKSIEIKNIELCYGQNITDSEDGQIKKVWYPFWVVEYAVRPIYTTTCSMEYIMYDACTGDRIMYTGLGLDE